MPQPDLNTISINLKGDFMPSTIEETHPPASDPSPLPSALVRHAERRFVIGQHADGAWFVTDRLGQIGGIFVSETAARHFAFEESFGHPEEIEVVKEPAPASKALKAA
jgi:hypothetical protein